MYSKEKIINISVYGIFHAFVDFCCAAIVFSYIGRLDVAELLEVIILYNCLAFGLQPLIGFAADKTGNARNYAIAGCGILALSFLFLKSPFLAVSVAGIGNAFYHIGGGVAALKMSEGKSLLSGIFVAPGAIGLFLGTLLYKFPSFQLYWLIGLMLGAMIVISMLDETPESKMPFEFRGNKIILIIASVLILISIAIRSFIGLSYNFSQKSHLILMFLFVISVALGKAFGGWFSDKFGMFKTGVFALTASLPLLYFAYNPFWEILGIMLFNFTMPVTLTALADMIPHKKGVAFGLTTLFLLIGALPPVLYNITVSRNFIFAVIVCVSVIITGTGLKIFELNKKDL